jgi:hypothetical protein
VEDIKLFEKSKLETAKPNNYEELKKNYYQTYKKSEEAKPYQLDLPYIDDKELDLSNCEPPETDDLEENKDQGEPE